jgi:putative transport protein
MDGWLTQFQSSHSVASALLLLAAVATLGLAIGSVRLRGVGLGVSGVLFAGLLFGHFGFTIEPALMNFVREFGLILFVYTIGMQVGPGFFTSLRRQGLPLNLMAAAIVLLGALLALLIGRLGKFDIALTAGIFAGATTNTPALGAAQEALKSLAGSTAEQQALPGIGYAVAYPFGIIGIILAMLALRAFFRVSIAREAQAFEREQSAGHEPLERMNLRVDNANLDGLTIGQLPGLREMGIVISRIKGREHAGVSTARESTRVHAGDVLLAVGQRSRLEEFRLIVGEKTTEDLMEAPGRVTWKRVVVTARPVLGKSLRELGLDHAYGITVTRVSRGALEMPATPDLRLQFGDTLQIVGQPESMPEATRVLGNSARELSHTNLVPVFVGIMLGILAGTYPFHLHGVPAPIRLGLAGGPLLIAVLLSNIGRIGPVIWYMPPNANTVLRELGIVLFLACVGIKAGAHFMEVLVRGDGLLWMAAGAVITLAPLLVVGVAARLVGKLNFMSLCGLLSGSMTDPPALAFANAIGRSDAPSVAYAAVYPLTMLLRIVVAQMMVLLFSR